MDALSNTLCHSIDSVDDKRKIMKVLDKNANLSYISFSSSSESDDSEDSSDERSASSSDSLQTSSPDINKKRKKKNSARRSRKKKKKNNRQKKRKEKSKSHVRLVSSLGNCDISKALTIMNGVLSDLSKSVEKLD